MPIMATMSPGPAESISSRLSACILTMRLKRCFWPVRWLKKRFALFDRALVNPHEGQLAERIFDDLERHADERLGRIGLELELLVGMLPVLGLDRPIERRRQIADDGVEQQLHALVLVGRAHVHRRQVLRLHGVADDRVDQFLGNALFRQQQLHQLVAVHRQAFEHLLPGGRGVVEQIGRNGFFADLFAVGAVEVDRPSS